MKKEILLMNTLSKYTAEYLSYCEYRKRLNFKTLKAYRIDLNQYSIFAIAPWIFYQEIHWICILQNCINTTSPSPSSENCQSESIFHYLEYADLLVQNPFDKLDVHFREAKLLPKTIPFHSIQKFLSVLYAQKIRQPLLIS